MSQLTYTIIRSPRKTVTLHILPSGKIEVRAPRYVPEFFIRQFVESKRDWIEKRITKQSQQKSSLLFLGIEHKLVFSEVLQITRTDTTIFFPRSLQFRLQKELQNWYVTQAKEIITQRVQMNAKLMKLQYQRIYFSNTSSKWGSCSPDNVLQFSWRLVMAPILVINYVVIHELAHISVKNHSPDFWKLVEQYNPSYKQQRLWLRKHGTLLHAIDLLRV